MLRKLLIVFLLVVAAAGFGLAFGYFAAPKPKPPGIETILILLRSQQVELLVTERQFVHVAVDQLETDLILGRREGHYTGTVKVTCGIDLRRLQPNVVERRADSIIVTVPPPQILDTSVDLNSIVIVTKRSVLTAAWDWFDGRDFERELRDKFEEATRTKLRREDLLPKRQDLVDRLNGLAPALSSKLGVKVAFR